VTDWGARADALQRSLHEQFWLRGCRLHRLQSGKLLWPFGSWNYWWQAHALGATLDAYDRTGEAAWRARADAVLGGIVRRGGGTAVNGFFDDMGWLAIELLRMQPARRALLERLVREIRAGSSACCGGGVSWAKAHRDFVNVPATGTAALVALRWGATRPDPELVGWGLGLLGWLRQTLVTDDGVVWDGVHARADGSCDVERAEYSYTYGLVLGAGLAAWHATGDRSHLDLATLVTATALARSTDPDTGRWRDEGGGDGGLFRGIFARCLADLAVELHDGELAAVLSRQGEAVWAGRNALGLVGPDWTQPPAGPVELSTHLTGVLVVEQCARLQRAGLVPRS
jgi:predicted alpha-1,6-mannanase (GH76 family)